MTHMLTFRIGLILFLCLKTSTVFAQYNNYQLKDYVNPDYKQQSLDFNINGLLDNTSTKQNGSNSNTTYKHDNDILNLNSTLSVGYKRIKNSVRTQNYTNAGFYFGGLYNNNKSSYHFEYQDGILSDQDYLTRKSIYSIGISLSHTGYYYGNNKSFLFFAPNTWFSYNHEKDKLDDNTDRSYDNSDKTFSTSGSLSVGWGKGRIEEIGDARQAVYILQDLQKQGVLKKELSQEEIDELARLITKVKYKRQFDHRIRLIQEITSIDSLLIEKDYIEKQHSVAYFTTLYDNWLYAGVSRNSGNRFAVSVRPTMYYGNEKMETVYLHQNDYTEHDTVKTFNYSVDLYAQYESDKPINLYWQRKALVEYSIKWSGVDYPNHYDYYSTMLSGGYGLEYIPNSRTSISGFITESLFYNFKFNNITTLTSLNFRMQYYFSPQLRLNASYRTTFNYQYTDDHDNDQISTLKYKYPNNYLEVSLQYSLF